MKFVITVLIGLMLTLSLFYYQESKAVNVMNATVTPYLYYYITISEKLSDGILFTNETGAYENVQYPLLSGSTNNNAVWNYNHSNNRTEYFVYTSGSVNVDLCHGATNHLCSNPGCSGTDNVQINISNVKWSSSLTNDDNNPSLSNAVPFVIGYDNEHKVASNLAPDSTVYLRYWLSLPPNTPALDYNTTYQIKAVISGESCG